MSISPVKMLEILLIISVLEFSCPNPLILIEYVFPLLPTGYRERISLLPYPASVR